MRCFTPLLSHKFFYHNYFLNIYYFILFNGWDWELLFSTLNLNHPMLLYQLQYLDLNPAIITLKIYIFSLITIEHLINFFFSSIIFVLIYFSIIFVFKKKKNVNFDRSTSWFNFKVKERRRNTKMRFLIPSIFVIDSICRTALFSFPCFYIRTSPPW